MYENKRWIRLASLYPERIDFVKFYRNSELIDIAYEEPYYIFSETTWIQQGIELTGKNENWVAEITLHSGDVIKRTAIIIAEK